MELFQYFKEYNNSYNNGFKRDKIKSRQMPV